MKKTQAIKDILNIADDLLTYKEEAERLISELESMKETLPSISENKEMFEGTNDMLSKLTIR